MQLCNGPVNFFAAFQTLSQIKLWAWSPYQFHLSPILDQSTIFFDKTR